MLDFVSLSDEAPLSWNAHFWLKATPPRGSSGSAFYATLICRDDEKQILNEARDAILASARIFAADWLVRISKPGCALMRREMSMEELFGAAANCRADEHFGDRFFHSD